MSAPDETRQMSPLAAAAVWAGWIIGASFFGTWLGFGGRRFAAALAVFAILLSAHLFLAARNVKAFLIERFGRTSMVLAPLVPLGAYLLYFFGVTLDAKALLAGLAYVLAVVLLVSTAGDKPAGRWQDYAAVLVIWLPVEFRWMYRLWPYPHPLTHTLTILFALATALTAFLFVRRLEGIGYAVDWKRGSAFAVGFHFLAFAAIAIPLGIRIGFLTFGPSVARLQSLPLAAITILFFTAWPEEFLFRGLLQNLLSRTFRSPWMGLAVASVIFGLSHLNNGGFPNWRYAILATIAGFFYGRAWMKTESLLAPCLVHALVDISWRVLFR